MSVTNIKAYLKWSMYHPMEEGIWCGDSEPSGKIDITNFTKEQNNGAIH